MFQTYVCSVLRAAAGNWSPHSAEISSSVDTTVAGFSARNWRSDRSLAAEKVTTSPASVSTRKGPRTLICTTADGRGSPPWRDRWIGAGPALDHLGFSSQERPQSSG